MHELTGASAITDIDQGHITFMVDFIRETDSTDLVLTTKVGEGFRMVAFILLHRTHTISVHALY